MDITTTIDTYFAAWNEPDADARTKLASDVLSATARYVDPLADVEGPAGFAAMAGAVQAQFPGHSVRLASALDQHHDQVRFAWELASADGTVVVEGIDVVDVDADGKLGRVAGFFGVRPEVAAKV